MSEHGPLVSDAGDEYRPPEPDMTIEAWGYGC
jgi:hypothetical protein